MRQRISPEELEKRRQAVIEKNVILEEKRLKELAQKSALFTGTFGKILWSFSLITAIFCALIIVDNFLPKKDTKFEIKSSSQDVLHVVKGGYLIPATFHWANLDDKNQFAIHMYKGEFNPINEIGFLKLGRSPIFKAPANFKVPRILGIWETIELQKSYTYTLFLPLFLIFLSILWLVAKPKKSLQWVMFGYLHMVVSPVFLLFIALKTIDFISDTGFYEIVIGNMDIPS